MSSTDGYCTIITFEDGEIGETYIAEESENVVNRPNTADEDVKMEVFVGDKVPVGNETIQMKSQNVHKTKPTACDVSTSNQKTDETLTTRTSDKNTVSE